MAVIEISDELACRIEEGAQRIGESRDAFVREAVLSRLEDVQDIEIATQRLDHPGRRYSLDEVGMQLGLDD